MRRQRSAIKWKNDFEFSRATAQRSGTGMTTHLANWAGGSRVSPRLRQTQNRP